MKPILTTSAHRVFCWMKTSFYLDIDNELTKNSYESCFIIGSHEAWNSTQLKNISRLTQNETVFALKSFKIRFWLFFVTHIKTFYRKIGVEIIDKFQPPSQTLGIGISIIFTAVAKLMILIRSISKQNAHFSSWHQMYRLGK